MTVDVDLGHLAEGMFTFIFPTIKLFSAPSSILYSLEERHYTYSHFKSVGTPPPLGYNTYIAYLEFYRGVLSVLLTYSLTFISMVFYFLDCNPIILYFIAQIVQLCPLGVLPVCSVLLGHTPINVFCYCFVTASLLYDSTTRCSRLLLESAISPRNSDSFQ